MLCFIDCHSNDCVPSTWEASMEIVQTGNPCELYVTARGSRFHLIMGRHQYGNFLCIPNWNIGTDLASWNDRFWNAEKLCGSCGLSRVDSETVSQVIAYLEAYI